MSRSLPTLLGALVVAAITVSCADPDPAMGNRVALGAGGTVAATATTGPPGTPTDGSDGTSTTTTTPVPGSGPADVGVVTVSAGGAPLSEAPGGEAFIQIHEDVVMGFTDRSGEWLQVVTTCNDVAWVPEASVTVTPQAVAAPPGDPGFDLSEAVVVVDPGHGARDWGGVGEGGLAEKHVNLDIAERIRSLMTESHAIDWSTGEVAPGDDVPALGAVWLTRHAGGPDEGDYELGLGFRAELANAAGADALVSIHNNTVPRVDTEIPGTEVFYAMGVEESDRLASLVYEELIRSLSEFEADWTGGELPGARARYDPDSEDDYYGLLRRAEMPAVIVEGVYIDQPDQEALLDTDEFRQAYAEGVYRGVIRFLTSGDLVDDVLYDPEPFPDDAGTVDSGGCELPAQP